MRRLPRGKVFSRQGTPLQAMPPSKACQPHAHEKQCMPKLLFGFHKTQKGMAYVKESKKKVP